MNRKSSKLFFVGTLIFNCTFISFCQGQVDLIISARGGIATFSMDDLKELQMSTVDNSEIQLVTTESFPSYYFWEISAGVKIYNKFHASLGFDYTSTGARSIYSDYSGLLRLEQVLTRKGVSVTFGYTILRKGKSSVIGLIKTSIIMTDLNVDNFLRFEDFDIEESETLSFKSKNVGISPGFQYQFSFGKLSLMATLGYEFNSTGKLQFKGNRSGFLANANNEAAVADWRGVRALIGVGYRFSFYKIIELE